MSEETKVRIQWVACGAACFIGGLLLGGNGSKKHKKALKEEQALRDSLTVQHTKELANIRAARDSIQILLYRAQDVDLQPLRYELEANRTIARTGNLDALDGAFSGYLDDYTGR